MVAAAALSIYVGRIAGGWRASYIVTLVLAVYLNYFVAVVQAFQKVGALHALAPAGNEPPFLIAQTATLGLVRRDRCDDVPTVSDASHATQCADLSVFIGHSRKSSGAISRRLRRQVWNSCAVSGDT